jgi:TonB family protein
LVVSILPDVAQELLVTRIAPEYPAAAQATEVQGTVVLRVTIGKDGHLTDVHVVSGPDMLQKTALSAVKQWVYTPYRVNGEPVSAQTWVKVAFPN